METLPTTAQAGTYAVNTVVTGFQPNDPAGAISGYTTDASYTSYSYSYPRCGVRSGPYLSPYYSNNQSGVWRITTVPPYTGTNMKVDWDGTYMYCEVLN